MDVTHRDGVLSVQPWALEPPLPRLRVTVVIRVATEGADLEDREPDQGEDGKHEGEDDDEKRDVHCGLLFPEARTNGRRLNRCGP